MRWSHAILFVVWALFLIGMAFIAAGEMAQGRLPDAALISSYAGFAGICLFISVRRALRAEALATTKASLAMRTALVLLYAAWLAAAISLLFVAEREISQYEKYDNANVLRVVGGLMIVVWCLAPIRLRLKHADTWAYRTPSTSVAVSDSLDLSSFKLGCGLIFVPLAIITIAWLVMLLLWVS